MRFGLWVGFLLLCRPSPSETIPSIHVQTFADAQVNLPADLHGKVGVLVMGFSKKSSAQTKQWNEVLLPDYEKDARIAYYECAVLAEVPALIRGMVLKGIRDPMPPSERAHFFPILREAPKWKEAAQFSASDDAYVLVVSSSGEIESRFHGAETPETLRHLKERVAELQKSIASGRAH